MSEENKVVEVPEKFKTIVEQIEKLSVLDLSELVKVLEEKFGVSAAAPVVMAGGQVTSAEATEEKTDFNVNLTSAGGNKIGIIKIVREVTGLGLKEAKDLVDGAPKTIKESVPKAEAEEIKKKIEEAGGTCEIK